MSELFSRFSSGSVAGDERTQKKTNRLASSLLTLKDYLGLLAAAFFLYSIVASRVYFGQFSPVISELLTIADYWDLAVAYSMLSLAYTLPIFMVLSSFFLFRRGMYDHPHAGNSETLIEIPVRASAGDDTNANYTEDISLTPSDEIVYQPVEGKVRSWSKRVAVIVLLKIIGLTILFLPVFLFTPYLASLVALAVYFFFLIKIMRSFWHRLYPRIIFRGEVIWEFQVYDMIDSLEVSEEDKDTLKEEFRERYGKFTQHFWQEDWKGVASRVRTATFLSVALVALAWGMMIGHLKAADVLDRIVDSHEQNLATADNPVTEVVETDTTTLIAFTYKGMLRYTDNYQNIEFLNNEGNIVVTFPASKEARGLDAIKATRKCFGGQIMPALLEQPFMSWTAITCPAVGSNQSVSE